MKSKSSEGKGIKREYIVKEIRVETNHFKTLMLGIKLGRLIGVGLSIDKIYPFKHPTHH